MVKEKIPHPAVKRAGQILWHPFRATLLPLTVATYVVGFTYETACEGFRRGQWACKYRSLWRG